MKWISWLLPFLPPVLSQIRGISIYGLETDLKNCQCSYKNGCEYYMRSNVLYGFNFFRIPFSAEYVHAGDFSVLDRIVDVATELNTTIMLDYHRTFNSHQGDWYETNLMDFLSVWNILLLRYYDKPIVQFISLYNEFQQNEDKIDFWNDVMTQSIHALELQYPKRFNWVVGGFRWGGSLQGIHVDLPLDNIYYDIHKYQFSKNGDDYRKDYEVSFGSIPHDRLIVGEYGWRSDITEQVDWAEFFLAYLKEKGYKNTIFWTLALSSDTGGIINDDCTTLETEKLNMLREFWELPPYYRGLRLDGNYFYKKKISTVSKDATLLHR